MFFLVAAQPHNGTGGGNAAVLVAKFEIQIANKKASWLQDICRYCIAAAFIATDFKKCI